MIRGDATSSHPCPLSLEAHYRRRGGGPGTERGEVTGSGPMEPAQTVTAGGFSSTGATPSWSPVPAESRMGCRMCCSLLRGATRHWLHKDRTSSARVGFIRW